MLSALDRNDSGGVDISYLEFEQSAFPYCAILARNPTIPDHQVDGAVGLTDRSSVEGVWVIFAPLATLLRESILAEGHVGGTRVCITMAALDSDECALKCRCLVAGYGESLEIGRAMDFRRVVCEWQVKYESLPQGSSVTAPTK
jgi:hypothetical protein